MRNEFTKRLKGLMALVLCFGMLFGNSIMVLAAECSADSIRTETILENGTSITALTSTGSGGVLLQYRDADGNERGSAETDRTSISSGYELRSVRVGNGTDIQAAKWIVLEASKEDSTGRWVILLQPYQEQIKDTNGGAGHEHTFEWDMTKVPTRTEDGEASYICKICGYVAATQPATRWQWFMKQYRDLVKNAEQNATITFEADDMPCISDFMLGFNIDRPDVTTIVHFTYEGVNYELTIPAGTDFSAIQNDTDDFYGYLGLAAKLGLTAKVVE